MICSEVLAEVNPNPVLYPLCGNGHSYSSEADIILFVRIPPPFLYNILFVTHTQTLHKIVVLPRQKKSKLNDLLTLNLPETV